MLSELMDLEEALAFSEFIAALRVYYPRSEWNRLDNSLSGAPDAVALRLLELQAKAAANGLIYQFERVSQIVVHYQHQRARA